MYQRPKKPVSKAKKKDYITFVICIILIAAIFGLNLYSLFKLPQVNPIFKVDNNVVVTTPTITTYKLAITDIGNLYNADAIFNYDSVNIPVTDEYTILKNPGDTVLKGDAIARKSGHEIVAEKDLKVITITEPTYEEEDEETSPTIIVVAYIEDSFAVINFSRSSLIKEKLDADTKVSALLSYKEQYNDNGTQRTRTVNLTYKSINIDFKQEDSISIKCTNLSSFLAQGFVLNSTITFIQKENVIGIDKRCVEYVYLNKVYVRLVTQSSGKTKTQLVTLTMLGDYGNYYEVSDTECLGNLYFLNPNKNI